MIVAKSLSLLLMMLMKNILEYQSVAKIKMVDVFVTIL